MAMFKSQLGLLTLFTTAAIFILVMLVGMLIYRNLVDLQTSMSVEEQAKDFFTPDTAEKKASRQNFIVKWNKYWDKRFVKSGVNFLAARRENAGRLALVVIAVVFVISLIAFSWSVIGAALVTIGVMIAMSIILGHLANKRDDKITGQIGPFLSALRSCVQSQEIPENALLKAISSTPDELHDELVPIEDQLRAGASLKVVLTDFYNRTSIDELRFLMACIILVADVGTDLDPELAIIQTVIENRQEISRHLKRAVASVMPNIYVASVAIPALFIYLYVSQPIAQQFWFKSFLSWICFAAVIALYALGVYMCKHLIDKIKNM